LKLFDVVIFIFFLIILCSVVGTFLVGLSCLLLLLGGCGVERLRVCS